nr:MAG TPA: hypothetical protein [Caudoviricetes sp.]
MSGLDNFTSYTKVYKLEHLKEYFIHQLKKVLSMV